MMTIDGLYVHSLTQELKETIQGGRISKIYQPFENELIIRIRAQRKNKDLLLSAHPNYSRIHLTNHQYENPKIPPHFCMVLRKYLEGANLHTIHQVENDRIIEFQIDRLDELGDHQEIVLVAELMGRHSNLILVDAQKQTIIDAIDHVPASQNSYRTLLPGATYIQAPSQEKLNPFHLDHEVEDFMVDDIQEKNLAKLIQNKYQGFGRQSANELAYQLMRADNQSQAFKTFIHQFKLVNIEPKTFDVNNKKHFTAFPYESLQVKAEKVENFPSLSQQLDAYFYQIESRDRVKQQATDLTLLVNNELAKNRKKLTKMEEELNDTKRAQEYQVKGEILTAFMHEVNQGDQKVTLMNFYKDNQPIEIELDPQKTPAENAQRYFSQYQKMKNRKKHLNKQVLLTQNTIHYLESVSTQIELAELGDIEEIRQELREEGYLKKNKKKTKQENKKARPREFQATTGETILVGRNNKQNDQLTTRTAAKNHWWLHAKDIPGSHVIIQSEQPSEQCFIEAATIAAYYSKYRLSNHVPVDAVQVRYVNKPKGAKPGFVTYEGQDTYSVKPEEDLVTSLQVK